MQHVVETFLQTVQAIAVSTDNANQRRSGFTHWIEAAVVVYRADALQVQFGDVFGDAQFDFTAKIEKAFFRVRGDLLTQLFRT
nr:hypothetical protein [Pantoea sp. CTOTU50773]